MNPVDMRVSQVKNKLEVRSYQFGEQNRIICIIVKKRHMKKRIAKYFDGHLFKEDCRKLGINFITASFIGGFVTHVTDMTSTALILLIWLACAGGILLLFGLFKK